MRAIAHAGGDGQGACARVKVVGDVQKSDQNRERGLRADVNIKSFINTGNSGNHSPPPPDPSSPAWEPSGDAATREGCRSLRTFRRLCPPSPAPPLPPPCSNEVEEGDDVGRTDACPPAARPPLEGLISTPPLNTPPPTPAPTPAPVCPAAVAPGGSAPMDVAPVRLEDRAGYANRPLPRRPPPSPPPPPTPGEAAEAGSCPL